MMLRICGLGTTKCCLYIEFLCTGAPFTDYMNNACIHYLHKVRDIELSRKIYGKLNKFVLPLSRGMKKSFQHLTHFIKPKNVNFTINCHVVGAAVVL